MYPLLLVEINEFHVCFISVWKPETEHFRTVKTFIHTTINS